MIVLAMFSVIMMERINIVGFVMSSDEKGCGIIFLQKGAHFAIWNIMIIPHSPNDSYGAGEI